MELLPKTGIVPKGQNKESWEEFQQRCLAASDYLNGIWTGMKMVLDDDPDCPNATVIASEYLQRLDPNIRKMQEGALLTATADLVVVCYNFAAIESARKFCEIVEGVAELENVELRRRQMKLTGDSLDESISREVQESMDAQNAAGANSDARSSAHPENPQ